MKKMMTLYILIWLVIVGVLTIGWLNDDVDNASKLHIVTVNRLQNKIDEMINNLPTDQVQSIESLSTDVKQLSKTSMDIRSIDIVEKNNEDLDSFLFAYQQNAEDIYFRETSNGVYVVRYEVDPSFDSSSSRNWYFFSAILLLSLMIGIVFLAVYFWILRPAKRLSQFPYRIAKGQLSAGIEQDKYGYYREFVWGLDVLREVLMDEKDKNIALEKQRKTLVASLSHDIKTPLSSIQNYSQALMDGLYSTQEERERALKIIAEKADIIEKLTKELLESSKSAMSNFKCEPKEIYLQTMLEQIRRLIHQKIDLKQIRFVEEAVDTNCLLIADMDRVLEVIDNVVENAVKYGDGESMSLVTEFNEEHLMMHISNSGNKVATSEVKYIFSSFYRGSNVGDAKGHGLGLYITKQLMKAMEGDVYATNTKDGFCISLVLKLVG